MKTRLSACIRAIQGWSAMVLVVVTFGACAWAQTSEPHQPIQNKHQAGRIRIFYYTEGHDAVDLKDRNGNHIPDQVEDALTQTVAAQTVFVDLLGFPDPFKTKRFEKAALLDIHFRHKDKLRNNGVAYDELQQFNRAEDPKGTLCICFNLATAVEPSSNLTPAHEYFHLIQNSTRFFKNRWFTEGTARWSQMALGSGALGKTHAPGSWPLALKEQKALFGMTYEASEQFWNPLVLMLEPDEAMPESPKMEALRAMTYTDGSKVLKDARLTGWRFMRTVLMELDKADDTAYRSLGYTEWSEENQKSPGNNPLIMDAVVRAVAATGIASHSRSPIKSE